MKKTILLAVGLCLLGFYFVSDARAMAWDAQWLCEQELLSLDDFLIEIESEGGGQMPPPQRAGKQKHRESAGKWQKLEEKINSLPPEQQEEARNKLKEMKQKKEAIRKELDALPPQERKARMEELKAEHESLRAEKREAFRSKFRERWDQSSDKERSAFCAGARERCAEGGQQKACDLAKNACASY